MVGVLVTVGVKEGCGVNVIVGGRGVNVGGQVGQTGQAGVSVGATSVDTGAFPHPPIKTMIAADNMIKLFFAMLFAPSAS